MRRRVNHLLIALLLVVDGANGATIWGGCDGAAVLGSIEVQAAPTGCSFVIVSNSSAAAQPAAVGTAAAPAGAVVEVAPGRSLLIAGRYNGSLGRPPAVQLVVASDLAAASAAVQPPPTVLVLTGSSEPGAATVLLLQDLLLPNVSLSSPQGDPNKLLLPTAIELPPGALLQLRDITLDVTLMQLASYLAFFLGVPGLQLLTDNATFVHIPRYASDFGLVEALSVTLICQEAASVQGQRIALLQSLAASSAGSGGASNPAVAAAAGDAAGVVTVTDSYVLGATNATLLPLLQQLAGSPAGSRPLFVSIATNVSLFPGAWGAAWPPGGLVAGRPLVLRGSSWRPTSIDLGMAAGQIVLQGEAANVTLLQLTLENLGPGDKESLGDAEGNSVLLANQLWAFKYRRSVPRLVLHSVVLVLPADQIEGIIYWVNAYNSDLPFWRNQTSFLRDTLKYSVIQYTRGRVPGDYVIIKALKKDQLMFNVTYTPTQVVAPRLPFIPDADIAAATGTSSASGRVETTVGAISSMQDLALTLWNQRQAGCSRPHVLLPMVTPLDSSSLANEAVGGGGLFFLTPGQLNVTVLPANSTTAGSNSKESSGGNDLLVQVPGDVQGVIDDSGGRLVVSAATAAAGFPLAWPPPGGQVISCPVEIRGRQGLNITVIDVAFTRSMFVVQPASTVAAAARTTSSSSGGSSDASPALLRMSHLLIRALPQGDSLSSSNARGAVAAATTTADDNTAWTAALPAAAFTHLMWTVARDLSGPASLALHNVTLALPAAEAALMYEAAAEAVRVAQRTAISTSGTAFTMVFPTPAGQLLMLYRDITLNGSSASGISASPDASVALPQAQPAAWDGAGRHRRMLLQQQPQPQRTDPVTHLNPVNSSMFCAGSMQGLGISARNVCMYAAINQSAVLLPGYFWVAAPADASNPESSRHPWPAWQVATVTLAAAAAAAAAGAAAVVCARRRRQHHRRTAAQAQAKPTAAAVSGSPTAAPAGPDDGGLPAGLQSADAAATAGAWAAAADADAGMTVAGSSSTGSSARKRGKAAAAPPAAAMAAVGARDEAASGTGTGEPDNSSSSSSCLKRLLDCCSSAETSGFGSSAASAAAAAGAPGASGTGSSNSNVRSSSPAAAAVAAAAVTKPAGSSCPAAASPMTVALGEQLGRLAALHRRNMSLSISTAAAGSDEHGPAPQQQQQQQQQQQPLLVTSQQHLQEQPSPLTAERLHQTINTVSTGMLLRRSTGGVRSSSNSTTALPVTPAAATPGRSPRQQGVAAGAQLRRRSLEQQVWRLSVDEERADTAAADPAAGLASLCLDDLPPGVLLQQAPETVPDQVKALSLPLREQQQPRLVRGSQARSGRSGSSSSRVAGGGGNQQLELHEMIGSGTFGVVYRATWRGIPAAVKVLQLPGAGAGTAEAAAAGPGSARQHSSNRREQMAVMEAALGSALSHPNIVQVFTHLIRPLTAAGLMSPCRGRAHRGATSSSHSSSAGGSPRAAAGGSPSSQPVLGYELQLVMEFCGLGSLRAAIDNCLLEDRLTGRPHYLTVLSLALGVARAMHHLHSEGIVHGDLKAGNVLLKMEVAATSPGPAAAAAAAASGGCVGGPSSASLLPPPAASYQELLVAKVADFGLASQLDSEDTHVSGVHRGTLNHMAPELLARGHASRASDVYAFGILLWELATGLRAFADVPKAMLGAAVVRDGARPEWPDGSSCRHAVAAFAAASAAAGVLQPDMLPPLAYRQLAEACWVQEPRDRPSFEEIAAAVEQLVAQEQQRLSRLQALARPAQPPPAAASVSGITSSGAVAAAASSVAAARRAALEFQAIPPAASASKIDQQAVAGPDAAGISAIASPASAVAAGPAAAMPALGRSSAGLGEIEVAVDSPVAGLCDPASVAWAAAAHHQQQWQQEVLRNLQEEQQGGFLQQQWQQESLARLSRSISGHQSSGSGGSSASRFASARAVAAVLHRPQTITSDDGGDSSNDVGGSRASHSAMAAAASGGPSPFALLKDASWSASRTEG